MKRSKTQNKLFNYTHAPVNITSSDIDPMANVRKSKPLDVGPIGVMLGKPSPDSRKIIYKRLGNGDYIIQPKFMLDSGSMCVTELYSKALRVRLVHELLFKEKMESKQDRFPIIKKVIERKEPTKLMKRQKLSDEMAMKKLEEKSKKRKQWKNKLLIPYEKKYLCTHYNTDIAGTLLKNPSKTQKLLKSSSYLRAKECLRALVEAKNRPKPKYSLCERFPRNAKLFRSSQSRSFTKVQSWEKLANLMQNYKSFVENTDKYLVYYFLQKY